MRRRPPPWRCNMMSNFKSIKENKLYQNFLSLIFKTRKNYVKRIITLTRKNAAKIQYNIYIYIYIWNSTIPLFNIQNTNYIVRKNKIDEKENEMNKNFLFVISTYIKHNLHFVLCNFFFFFWLFFFF